MGDTVIMTKELFNSFFRGCGGRHLFVAHEEITFMRLEEKVQMVEHEYGINAWQKNVCLVTTPVTNEERALFRSVARALGYQAYISNEDASCASLVVEFCEIILIRIDVAHHVSR